VTRNFEWEQVRLAELVGALLAGVMLAACSSHEIGGTGGGSATGGSSTAGGGAAAGGGSAMGGGGSTGGGSATGAGMTDPCLAAPHDPVLGTLVLDGGATVVRSAPLPDGVVGVQEVAGALYGLFSDATVRPLGAASSPDAGAVLADVIAPADRNGGAFVSLFLAGTATHLLAGYTTSGSAFPGNVALIDVHDAGVRYVNAPANFSAVGFSDGFAINGGGIGTVGSEDAVYLLDTLDAGTSELTSFDMSWMAASGFNASTSQQVLLLGYFDVMDSKNHVRAAPPAQYGAAVSSGTPFMLSASVEVAASDDIVGLGSVDTDAVVVHGGFLASGSFASHVDRVPLALAGATVTPGATKPMLVAHDECTSVLFTATTGTSLLLGISDKNGQRLVTVSP
jgi:hypothetical protein